MRRLLFALLAMSAGIHANNLSIIQHSPDGEMDSLNSAYEISATFSEPMVALSGNEDMGSFCPIHLSPALPGRCRWKGTNTLVYEVTSGAIKPGQQIKVSIDGGIASQVSGDKLAEGFQWQFITERPRLVSSAPRHQERWISLHPKLYLAFSLTMAAESLGKYIYLEEDALDQPSQELDRSRLVPVSIDSLKRKEYEALRKEDPMLRRTYLDIQKDQVIRVTPSRELKPDRLYRLWVLKGAPSEDGGAGTALQQTVDFETYYSFVWKGNDQPGCGYPAGHKALGRNSSDLSFMFSNPIDEASFLEHLKITPQPLGWNKAKEKGEAVAQGDEGGDEGEGEETVQGKRTYESRDPSKRMVADHLRSLVLKMATPYTFTISAGMKDAFGNTLKEGASFTYTPPDYCASLEMNQGFSILESYLAPRHPVDGMNADNAPLKLWSFDRDRMVPAYRGMEQSFRSFDKGAPSIVRSFAVSLTRNVAMHSFVDLAPALKGSRGGLVGLGLIGPNCSTDDCAQYALDNLTSLGLTFKTAPDSTLLWVTRLRTGQPVAGVPLQLRLADNKVVWSGVSGPDGTALAPGWRGLGITSWDKGSASEDGDEGEGYYGYSERPKLYAIATHGDGDAIIGSQLNGGIEPWRFNINIDYNPQEARHRGLLFSDRDVYKPGETVKFKGVVRSLEVDDWGGSKAKTLDLVLNNSRGETVLKKTVELGPRSSFDLSFDVPADAPTGGWNLRAFNKRRQFNLYRAFRVEAFKPAAFEVRLQPSRSDAIQGESLSCGVEGWYLFGAPMVGAEAEYNVVLQPSSFDPPGWPEFDFTPGWPETTGRYERPGGSAKFKLDSQGRGQIQVTTQGVEIKGPYLARFESGVTSADRQRLFGRSSIMVHPSTLYAGIKSSARVAEVGQALPMDVVVTTLDGKVKPGVTVKGSVRRHEYFSVRKTGMAGRLEWRYEARDVDLPGFELKSADKPLSWQLKGDKPGEYTVTLSVTDAEGHENRSRTQVYVAGPGQAWWGQEDHDLIQLVADKNEYHPGEEAKILIQSPWTDSEALVTVERETVMDRFVVHLKGGADFVKIPIQEKYLPNAFVSVTVVKGRGAKAEYDDDGLDLAKPQAKFGYLNLAVHPEGRRLSVVLSTDKSDYRPGGEVSVDLKVRNAAGAPELAEVTLYAVDEGVLQLTGYQTPDLFQAFYGPRPLYVLTADSRLAVLGQRNFGEKGQARGGGGGGAGLEGIDLRNNFRYLAHWNATVMTDGLGNAKTKFKLPDNLSAFRVMAVVHAGKRFGKAETRIRVNKPLMLRPSLPRFARLGDAFKGGVVVHNDSKVDAKVTVELKTESAALVLSGTARQVLSVKAGTAAEALWDLAAPELGQAKVEFRASADLGSPETDGLSWKLPVILPEKLETVATSGVSEGDAQEALRVPSGSRIDKGKLRATLSSSALSGLKDGVAYLLDYPHGCLEQRLSKSLPVVAGAELLSTFQLGDFEGQKRAVQEVMSHLPDFQHGSGGYCYWPGCGYEYPSPELTAYALEVAYLAKAQGYTLPQASIDRGVAFLKSCFEDQKQHDWGYPYSEAEVFEVRAYALDVLSLYNEAPTGYLSQLYAHRSQLPFLAKAHLLKAAQRLSQDPSLPKTLAQELLNQAKLSPRSLHFEEPAGTRMPWVHESTVRSTAVCLEALLTAQGGFPGDEKAIAWLTGERKDKGVWRSTQENAWGLRAFQAFFKRYESKAPSFTASLLQETAAGKSELWNQAFEGRSLETKLRDFPLPGLFKDGSQARLDIQRKGEGRLYYSLAMDYLPGHWDKPAWEGFEVTRVVKELGSQTAAVQPYKAGKKYAVTLTVRTRQDRTFVALSDPLPGGFEVIDSSFATEGEADARKLAKSSTNSTGWNTFNRAENYDDRVQVYCNFMQAGEHSWTYLVQATTPGNYSVPAAWVEQMYEPEVFGRTPSTQAEVR